MGRDRTTIRASHKGDDVRHNQPFVLLLGRGSQASICAYPPERKFLWIVRRLFLLGNREGVNIHHQLGSDAMRPGRLRTRLPTDLRDSNEEARAALRQAVRAACADLAEMDQLLERAEQLVSSGFGTDRPARFTLDAIQ